MERRKDDVLEEFVPLPVPTSEKARVHVATLHLRSYNDAVPKLAFFTSFAMRAAKALGMPTTNMVSLPTRTTLWTVPRSPFVHKKSQENFWRKEHKRAVKVYAANEQIVDAWFGYLRKNAMAGVGMKAQTFVYRPLDWYAKSVSSSTTATTTTTTAATGDESAGRATNKKTTSKASAAKKAKAEKELAAGGSQGATDRDTIEQRAKQLEQELAQSLDDSTDKQ